MGGMLAREFRIRPIRLWGCPEWQLLRASGLGVANQLPLGADVIPSSGIDQVVRLWMSDWAVSH